MYIYVHVYVHIYMQQMTTEEGMNLFVHLSLVALTYTSITKKWFFILVIPSSTYLGLTNSQLQQRKKVPFKQGNGNKKERIPI